VALVVLNSDRRPQRLAPLRGALVLGRSEKPSEMELAQAGVSLFQVR